MSKSHTNFKMTLIEGSKYLKDNIVQDRKDEKKFICLPCKQSYKSQPMWFNNLKEHLNSNKHKKTADELGEEEALKEAILYLEKKGLSQSQKDENDNVKEEQEETKDKKKVKSRRRKI